MKSKGGMKVIDSVRQVKARVLVHLRASAHDVVTNSETVRLMDLIERMKEEGTLIPFYLDALKTKLRTEEQKSTGQVVHEVVVVSPPQPRQSVSAVQSVDVASPPPQQQRTAISRDAHHVLNQPSPTQVQPAQYGTFVPNSTVDPQPQELPQDGNSRGNEQRSSAAAQSTEVNEPLQAKQHLAEKELALSHHAPPEGNRPPSEIIASMMQRIEDVRDGNGSADAQPPPSRRMRGNGLRAMG